MTTIGVLTIGSLYWGNDRRQSWRDKYLDCANRECVKVPIRYGRRSSQSWADAYTMVVSPLPAKEWGTAFAVPFKSKFGDSGVLVKEAERLWNVEDSKAEKDSISAKNHWGRVALLENPDRDLPEKLRKAWTDRIAEEKANCRYKIPKDGEFEDVVDPKSGRLINVDWPSTTDGKPLGWSALLVAVTDPKGPKGDCCRYPTPKEIAKAWKDKEVQCYFWKNQQHGITTFQDAEIKEELKQPAA